MRTRINFLGVVGSLLAASGAYAGLGGSTSLLGLSQSSSMIVVGGASGATQSGTELDFNLEVSRVIKGDAAVAGTIIPVQWQSWAQGMVVATDAAPAMTGYGLWFLQASSKRWVLLPWFLDGFIPEPPGPILSAYSYTDSASLTDKIASEVSNAIEGNGGARNSQLAVLHGGQLETLNSPVVQVLYQRLSVSPSSVQQELGVGGLIRGESAAAIAAAAKLARTSTGVGALVMSILNDFRPTDAASVSALGQAAADATDPNTAFREAAAHALAAIHTAAAVPYLGTLLGDADAIVRAEGVVGLSSFANGLPVQTSQNVASMAYLQAGGSAPYKTADTIVNGAMGAATVVRNEGRYLPFWKNWWAQNQESFGN